MTRSLAKTIAIRIVSRWHHQAVVQIAEDFESYSFFYCDYWYPPTGVERSRASKAIAKAAKRKRRPKR